MVGGGNAVIMHTSLEGPTRDIDWYFLKKIKQQSLIRWWCVNTEFELETAVFSLNFSSAGNGTFMAGEAKYMPQRCTLPRGRG